jgi:hypothetical protein
LRSPFNFYRTTSVFCAGASLPLNILLVIFLIHFGTSYPPVLIFAYLSAIPCAALCVALFTLGKAGYTHTPIQMCFIAGMALLWLVEIVNTVICGYLAYMVYSPMSSEGKSQEEVAADAGIKGQQWLGPVAIMDGVLGIISLLMFNVYLVKMRDRAQYDKEVELTGLRSASSPLPGVPYDKDSSFTAPYRDRSPTITNFFVDFSQV